MVCHGDLLFPAGQVGQAGSSVGSPRGDRELQTTQKPITGINRPIATRFTLCHSVPVDARVSERAGVGGASEREDAADGYSGSDDGAVEDMMWSQQAIGHDRRSCQWGVVSDTYPVVVVAERYASVCQWYSEQL